MATLSHPGPGRAHTFPPMPPERVWSRKDIDRYLGPGERVIYLTRRHPVVLLFPAAVWFMGLIVGFGTGLSYRPDGRAELSYLGAAIILSGSVLLAWRIWQWWRTRYVLTNNRILITEGILSRRINGLLLRSVLDTTYHRSLAGRLFGYGDLELSLCGQLGSRRLTSVPRPDTIYILILSLTSVRDVEHSISSALRLGEDAGLLLQPCPYLTWCLLRGHLAYYRDDGSWVSS